MNEADTSGGPLSGIRVLDLTAVIMGPFATQILGDLGADVISVEKPAGDSNRVMGKGPHPQLSGVALNLLRNKRNVSLDFRQEEGRAALLKIAASCDVLVTNIRPDGLRRSRLCYEDIAAVRPDIVYCEAHGYPLGSAEENYPAYDDIMQARTGVADAIRRQSGTPMLAPTLIADKVCGMSIAYAVSAALVRRERTGRGDHIEVPMVDAMLAWMLVEHGASAIPQPPLGEAGYVRILSQHRKPQRTADGWINVLPYGKDSYDALFQAGGRADLVGDARYASARARIANSDFLYSQVAQVIAERTTAEWLDFCKANDIPATAVATLESLVDALPDAEHPEVGRYKQIPPPVRFAEAPASVRRPAPLIGANTDEVLAEVGLTAEEIEKLHVSGVIPAPPELG